MTAENVLENSTLKHILKMKFIKYHKYEIDFIRSPKRNKNVSIESNI